MDVQVSTANNVDGHEAFGAHFESVVRQRLSRFEDRLTRIEIHFSDANSEQKGGEDKRCVIEARPAGLAPVAVTDQSATHEQAALGALEKLAAALDRTFGKQTDRKGH